MPVHGEYQHLVKHGRLAESCGVDPEKIILLEDGQPLSILPDSFRLEDRVPVECTLVDGKGVGDVGSAVLKERRILGDEGMVIVVLVVDSETGSVLHGPEMISKGLSSSSNTAICWKTPNAWCWMRSRRPGPASSPACRRASAPPCGVSSAACWNATRWWCPLSAKFRAFQSRSAPAGVGRFSAGPSTASASSPPGTPTMCGLPAGLMRSGVFFSCLPCPVEAAPILNLGP